MASITISEILRGAWLERALYTAEERGIPAFVDGLKPVQRFLVCKALKIAKNKFEKVSTIATVATEGYHHGEQSSAAALVCMAQDFANNLPLFEGDGNFGNVLDTSAGAPRYIYAKLTPLFEYIFKDMDLCPVHDDPEHIPPKYYLPIIPLVLINGIKGIATGYSTDIPPHDPLSIIDWLIAKAKNKPVKDITPKYYDFTGEVTKSSDHYNIFGKYEQISPIKIKVTELPRGYTCALYNNHLKKLQDKGIIVDYENNSRMNRFEYIITLKRGTRWNDETIRKNLKLNTTHTWNLTTVSSEGKIQEWDKLTGINDIMESFYNFRVPYIAQRIKNIIDELTDKINYLSALKEFCNDVINDKFSFKGVSEDEFANILKTRYNVPTDYITRVMNMPVRVFTVQMIQKLESELNTHKQSLSYYTNTTPEKEYIQDLTELKKAILSYSANH